MSDLRTALIRSLRFEQALIGITITTVAGVERSVVVSLILPWDSRTLFSGKLRAAHLVQTLLSCVEYQWVHRLGVLRNGRYLE